MKINIKIGFIILALSFPLLVRSQQEPRKHLLNAVYEGGDVVLEYNPDIPSTDSLLVNVFRKSTSGEVKLHINRKISAHKTWVLADTTTRKKPGIYQYIFKSVIEQDTLIDHVWAYAYPPDLIPIAGNMRIANIKDSNALLLSWQIEDNYIVKNITVQRSRKKDSDYQPIAVLQGHETNYLDRVHDANEAFFYRIDMSVHHSDRVYQSASIFTLPEFPIIPEKVRDATAEQTNNKIKINWQSDDVNSRAFYILKRANNMGPYSEASVAMTANQTQNYIWEDTAQLEHNTMYQYVILSESNSYHRSNSVDTLMVFFQKQIAALNPPQDLRIMTVDNATFHLVWSVDSLQNTFNTSFDIYIKNKGTETYRLLNSIEASSNSIEIDPPKDGDTFKIVATHQNQKSDFSIPLTYSNPHEGNFGPKYLVATPVEEGLLIRWTPMDSKEIKHYVLTKWNGEIFEEIETLTPASESVITSKYEPGKLNIYKLFTIKNNGVKSNGSEILELN